MMKVLFLHQNFPGQFRHLAPALQTAGHEVLGLGVSGPGLPRVKMLRYKQAEVQPPTAGAPAQGMEPLTGRLQGELRQGASAAQAMAQLRRHGYKPDVVVAHPGWGEALFVKDVWPRARLVVFSEFYLRAEGADYGFDPEFPADNLLLRGRLRLRNSILLHSLVDADRAYSPTHWQRSVLPPELQSKVQVIFDGIDTSTAKPDSGAHLTLPPAVSGTGPVKVSHGDEVLTFVNRNLEPYRGFHIFMRALPAIMQARPLARCVIVGGDEVSYGRPPARESGHAHWRSYMLAELGSQLPLDRIHFVGKLPYADYLRVLQVSRCHVYLTYPYVLGWSCLEAMAAGAVVVGSDTPPVREVIQHGHNGLLVGFFDIAALAQQVCEVLTTPAAFTSVSNAARETVLARYELNMSLAAQMSMLTD